MGGGGFFNKNYSSYKGYIVKENHIGSGVSKILPYRQSSCYLNGYNLRLRKKKLGTTRYIRWNGTGSQPYYPHSVRGKLSITF